MLKGYIETFGKYRFLLMDLIARDFKVKYRRSFLGVAWSLLNPIMMMLILSAVFSSIIKPTSTPHFHLYLMSGQTIFTFFNESTTNANYSIVSSSHLIKKVYIPKYIFPLETVLFSFVNSLFSVGAYLIIMLFTPDIRFSWTAFLFPVPLIALLIFSSGFGMILAAICVFFRDMRHLYSVLTMAWMYLTPIFYPFNQLEDSELLSVLLRINPLTWYVEYFRECLYYPMHDIHSTLPFYQMNIVCFGWAFLFLALGLWTFRKTQDRFILYV